MTATFEPSSRVTDAAASDPPSGITRSLRVPAILITRARVLPASFRRSSCPTRPTARSQCANMIHVRARACCLSMQNANADTWTCRSPTSHAPVCVVGQANEGRRGIGLRVWARETRRPEGRLSLARASLRALPPCIPCTHLKHTGGIGPRRGVLRWDICEGVR